VSATVDTQRRQPRRGAKPDVEDARVLEFCGLLGHTVIVVCSRCCSGCDKQGRGRSSTLHTTSVANARTFAAENAGIDPVIYRLTRHGWRAVGP
jgi:hypothetical protein